MSDQSVFEAVGGHEAFDRLTTVFYEGVATDPLLSAMYPADLAGARDRLRMFLEQFWGGPTTYSHERGHPALRMRHAPFAIDIAAREAWLHHMRVALAALELPADRAATLWEQFERTADFLRNTAEPGSADPDDPTDVALPVVPR